MANRTAALVVAGLASSAVALLAVPGHAGESVPALAPSASVDPAAPTPAAAPPPSMPAAPPAASAAVVVEPVAPPAHSEDKPAEPFAFGDFTWLNGSNRQHKALLDSEMFTGSAILDANYTYSFAHPKDHTIVGSTIVGRSNEFNVVMAGLGGDFHYDNVRATMTLQFGTYSTLVPVNDPSVNRGQWDLRDAFRYIREANAGYHFNVLNGLNIDAGIFMSYIGLFSYVNFENWAYQPSYLSDNTPFFFQGIRAQLFPSDKLKVEVWVTNGWQSYGMFNEVPGLGFQILSRPAEWVSIVANGYFGYDTFGHPDRMRVHSDNSLLVRYINNPASSLLRRAAFSLTADYGFESGGGVSPFPGMKNPEQSFQGIMLYNRFWFDNDHYGFTYGIGAMRNPGRYLVLVPPAQGFANVFTENIGDKFLAWDTSFTFDWMPTELITYRAEFIHRQSDVPYFEGPDGVTSPSGLTTDPNAATYMPTLLKYENRISFVILFRM